MSKIHTSFKWTRIIFVVAFLLISSQSTWSQQPSGRFYNRKCKRLQLGGVEKQLLERLAKSLGTEYGIKLAPWPDNPPGHRHIDLLGPGENSETTLNLSLMFGSPEPKVRRDFPATNAGTLLTFPLKFGPFTLPEAKRTWLLAATGILTSHYTGLDEQTIAPELEKLLKRGEALNLTNADLDRSISAGKETPMFESDFGDYTVILKRDWGTAGFTVYRFSCR